MTRAIDIDSRRPFAIADLNTELGDEPRVLDAMIAERLGMAQPRNIRVKIKENFPELSTYGEVCTKTVQTSERGGRPGKAYYLNEPQAILICMWANTSAAAAVRKMLIDVFMEYRRGKSSKPVDVVAHSRRTSTKIDDAIRLRNNIDRLESAVCRIAPMDRFLSAMVIDGEPVIVDVNDFAVPEGERAVVVRWNGKLAVEPISHLEHGHKYAGERSAYGPIKQNQLGKQREGVVIVGRVIERTPIAQSFRESSPAAAPHLIEHYRGRRTLFRDQIVELLDTGMTNREIARKTGATYQTVTHWRRWKHDRQEHEVA